MSARALAVSRPAQTNAAPPVVREVLRSAGEPLDRSARSWLEPRLGHDFGSVKIHSDARAAASARAMGANAYTVGSDVVFAPGLYQPHTSGGRRLLAHELIHSVQQGGASPSGGVPVGSRDDRFEREAERGADLAMAKGGAIPAISRGRSLAVQREPANTPNSFESVELTAGEDISEKNPKLASIAAKAKQMLSTSPQASISVLSYWTSKQSETPSDLRVAARTRGEAVQAALVKLGVPAAAMRVGAPDLNEDGAPPGTAGNILVGVLAKPLDLTIHAPLIGPLPSAPEPKGVLLTVSKDGDVTNKNVSIVAATKGILGQLNDPGGKILISAYVANPEVPLTDAGKKARSTAEERANTVADTMKGAGAPGSVISTDVKFVPASDARAGQIVVSFIPTVVKPPESSFDFDKFTTIEVKGAAVSLVIKIPKSIELKNKFASLKLNVPKSVEVNLTPVRGLPGLEIGLKGEITSLADLAKKPTPPTPGPDGFTNPAAGPPVKFSLSVAVNQKGYRLEANASVDVNKRVGAGGIFVTIFEAGHKYQIPSSVFDDLNQGGAKLQKAVNSLMRVPDQLPATAPVGPAPPMVQPVKPADTLSDLSDVADAIGSIADAMDKINKAKDKDSLQREKFKFGPTITVPFGPAREPSANDPIGKKPIYGFTGMLYF